MRYLPTFLFGGVYVSVWAVALTETYSVFTLHPIGMSLLFSVLTLAILQFSSRDSSSSSSPASRSELHAQLMYLGSGLLLLAMAAIEAAKYLGGGPHLVSWHGWLGALCLVPGFISVVLLSTQVHTDPQRMKGLLRTTLRLPSVGAYWKWHRSLGWLLYSLVYVEMLMGFLGYDVVRQAGRSAHTWVPKEVLLSVQVDSEQLWVWTGVLLLSIMWLQVTLSFFRVIGDRKASVKPKKS